MGFKIEKQAAEEPKYCDYIQQKIDIAKENGAVYELSDEDYRIQALYDQKEQKGLVVKDKIKMINRIRSTDDGKQYLVVNKDVVFYTPDPINPKEPGVYKDRYSTREGIVELPLKTTNPDTGAVETNQTRLVYTDEFSPSKVDKYLRKAEEDGQGGLVQFTFYDGATTSNRLPTNIPTVGNAGYFKEASWNELLLGKEKKVLNSLVNRLPEVRKELKEKGGMLDSDEPKYIPPSTPTTPPMSPEPPAPSSSSPTVQPAPKEEVNKHEVDKQDSINEGKSTPKSTDNRKSQTSGKKD